MALATGAVSSGSAIAVYTAPPPESRRARWRPRAEPRSPRGHPHAPSHRPAVRSPAARDAGVGEDLHPVFGPFAQQDGTRARSACRSRRCCSPIECSASKARPARWVSARSGPRPTSVKAPSTCTRAHARRHPGRVGAGRPHADLMAWRGLPQPGERVYRLLGCELTSHGALPTTGDTLHYEITVDGHASTAATCDCSSSTTTAGSTVSCACRVRNGQAGFFTDEELAESAGRAVVARRRRRPTSMRALDRAGAVHDASRRFTADMVTALHAKVDCGDCFGPGFERADAHTRTPTIAAAACGCSTRSRDFDPAAARGDAVTCARDSRSDAGSLVLRRATSRTIPACRAR